MLVRAVLGAVAGAIAAVGLRLTWRSWVMPSECFEANRWLCAVWLDGELFMYTLSWAIMAGLLLSGALSLLKRPRAMAASVLGGVGWLVLWVVTGVLGLIPDEDSLAAMLVVVYTLAGAGSRSSAHGEAAAGST